MTTSNSALRSATLNRAWIQWGALGVSANVEADPAVVDPEALVALTAELRDSDARLRDASTDWCVAYGRYVNGARLKRVATDLRTPSDAIGEYAATVAVAGGPKWPLATLPRLDYVARNKARLDSATPPARLRIRLRAAFGVNARADVLAALLDDAGHDGLSIPDLARRARFTKTNIVFVVEALQLAGLIETRMSGPERRYALGSRVALLPGVRRPIPQPDWVARFRVVLELLRFEARPSMTVAVRAIEARRLVEAMWDEILREEMPRPVLAVTGPDFASGYDRWLVSVVDWLRGQK